VDNKDVLLKWTVDTTKVVFEVVYPTTAYIGVGFAHANDTSKNAVYFDGFVGGYKDGAAYGASYNFTKNGGDLKRQDGNRYTVCYSIISAHIVLMNVELICQVFVLLSIVICPLFFLFESN